MSQSFSLDTPRDFATLVPLNSLPEHLLAEVLSKSRLETLDAGSTLCQLGQFDDDVLYLLKGTVDLINRADEKTGLRSNSRQARHPLVPGRPRKISVQARTRITVLRIAASVLDSCLLWSQAGLPADHDPSIPDTLPCTGLFTYIPASNIALISARMERVEVNVGEAILRQNEEGDYYYILRAGHCAVSRRENGQTIELAELSPGDTFGEEALVANTRRNATITATCECVLDRLTKTDFVELIQAPLLTEVDRDTANAKVEKGAYWLDVRLAEEYQQAAIEDSINLPLADLRDNYTQLDKGHEYILVCDTGNRSAAAAFLLAERGYHVKHLPGGLLGSSETADADHDPVAQAGKMLSAQLTEAEQIVEAALQQKAITDTSLAVLKTQTERLEARKDPALLSRLAAQFKSDNKRLSKEARQTEKTLHKAQQTRLKLEAVLLAYESLARQGLESARDRQAQLSIDSKEKLVLGEQQLESEYTRAAKALEEISKHQAEHQQTSARKEQQYSQLLSTTEKDLQALEERRQQLLDDHDSYQAQYDDFQESSHRTTQELEQREKRIRIDSEQRLRQQRLSLESEFAHSMELIDVARKRQQDAEAAMRRAEKARREAEQKSQKTKQKMQEKLDEKLNQQRARLVAEEKEIQGALLDAQQVEKTARDAQRAVANQVSGEVRQRELKRRQQDVEEARAQVKAAKTAKVENEISQRVVNDTMKKWDGTEDTLRRRVKNELQGWLKENELREQQENQAMRTIRNHLKQINQKIARDKEKEQSETQDMFNEIRNMLNDSDG